MMRPTTLLRDTVLAGLVLVVLALLGSATTDAGALVFDGITTKAVGLGAAASALNVWLLGRAVTASSPGMLVSRLAFANVGGAAALFILLAGKADLPPGPVLIGFCAVLLALGLRAAAGVYTILRSSPTVEA